MVSEVFRAHVGTVFSPKRKREGVVWCQCVPQVYMTHRRGVQQQRVGLVARWMTQPVEQGRVGNCAHMGTISTAKYLLETVRETIF